MTINDKLNAIFTCFLIPTLVVFLCEVVVNKWMFNRVPDKRNTTTDIVVICGFGTGLYVLVMMLPFIQ